MNKFEHEKWTEPYKALTPEQQAENRRKQAESLDVKAERERCAKIAEGHKAGRCRSESCCGEAIAKAIRGT